MPLFICRWQNGDSSAVSATSRNAAIELLDEVGNAEVCELFTVKNFMVHFRLKEETDEIGDFVPVKLEGFDEETVDTLCDRVYPRSMMEWQRLCANGHLREFFPRHIPYFLSGATVHPPRHHQSPPAARGTLPESPRRAHKFRHPSARTPASFA